jgi:hypothetical protein
MATGVSPTTTTTTDQMDTNQHIRTDKQVINDKKSENIIPISQSQPDPTTKDLLPINTTTTDASNTQLLSSQPRFSTSDIIQKFPYIKHRYCHKLRISIPWNDKDNIPTYETYYKAIHYFLNLLKATTMINSNY